MSNGSDSESQQNKNSRFFQCSKCTCSFSHRRAYHEHLHYHATSHITGRQQQMNDLSTEDNTFRYIAERRKNYPTADNISKKMKSDEERHKRGDVLQTRQFGRVKERENNQTRTMETQIVTPITTATSITNTNPRTTLLERLLAPDIRRERNLVLQCIRHIVNKNFYGLDDN